VGELPEEELLCGESNMTMTANNGVRKSLSDQIDRLDQVLDGLADGLNGTIAEAVREIVGRAVKEAVQAVLIEVLTNPAVLEKLRGAPAPVPQAEPTMLARIGSQAKAWTCAGLTRIRVLCGFGARQAGQAVSAAQQRAKMVWSFRGPLMVALTVGGATGIAAYFAGPWLTAAATAIAGFTATAAAQAVLALRRMLAYAGMSENRS
jgi:hypothetical protein